MKRDAALTDHQVRFLRRAVQTLSQLIDEAGSLDLEGSVYFLAIAESTIEEVLSEVRNNIRPAAAND